MIIMNLLVGIVALIFGRRLFWLFVGVIGFIAGVRAAPLFFSGLADWVVVIIAFIGGIIGALLAVFFQRLAVVCAGFAAGAYLVLHVLTLSGWQGKPLAWLPVLIGGLVGALLLYFLFDWTLIFLSSVVGASLITQTLPLSPPIAALLLMGLFIAGFATQAKMMKRNRK